MVLERMGFHIAETGGGCTAWRKDFDDGGYVMLTADASHDIGRDDALAIGVYTRDGDVWVCDNGGKDWQCDGVPLTTRARTVRDVLDDSPMKALMECDMVGEETATTLLNCPAESVCGVRIIELHRAAMSAYNVLEEHDLRERALRTFLTQMNVVLFG